MPTAQISGSSSPSNESVMTLVNRIKAEYLELPGLQLTPWQAQRLWGLDDMQCEAILGALVDASFLRRTTNGSYVRMA